MSIRYRTYKGQRAVQHRMPAVILFIAVLLFLAILLAFSLLPEYLVFNRDGVRLVVPSLQEDGQGYSIEAISPPQKYRGDVTAQIQISAPDYTNVSYGSVSGLNYMQCYYVPFSKASSEGLENAVKEAQRSGVKGLCLQMKDESGMLAWLSTVDLASSLALNSAWNPSAELMELKADGWYLVAEISCAVDTALATKNGDVALRDTMGAVYETSAGSWVDLWNRDVREYTEALCRDLLELGFDEVILDHVEHPQGEAIYTREVASGLDHTASIMNFSIAVREALEEPLKSNGAHLCVNLNHDGLSNMAANGQSLENMLKVFDRVVVETETYSDDVHFFLDAGIDSTLRFVPRMAWSFSGGSWILDSSVGAE